jgi:hypothetical protein
MEYVTYVLIILGIMVLCVMLFWRKDFIAGGRRQSADMPADVDTPAKVYARSDSRLNVPTPWGWPGNDSVARSTEDRSVSESLHRFVDHLISEKQTVEDREYLLKKDENIRLLMEDRYGSSRVGKWKNGDMRSGKAVSNESPDRVDRSRGSLHDVRKPWGW